MFKIDKEEHKKNSKTIRFEKDLAKRIEIEAKKNKVSFNKYVNEACKYALKNIKSKNT